MDAPLPDVLLVDDDARIIRALARILTGMAQMRFASNGEQALQMARDAPPDLVLLDAQLPGMSGMRVCETLKAEVATAQTPVVFVTSHSEAALEIAGFDVGAADFIRKPLDGAVVRARVRAQLRVKRMADDLRRLAAADALTGLANRRRFDEVLDAECRRSLRHGHPVALLMIDVDHFKRYNDHYGHPAGDACLAAVGRALATLCLRAGDCAARYGGEEFALLLPHTGGPGAEHVAQRLLDVIDTLAIAHAPAPPPQRVSVSVGLSCHAGGPVAPPLRMADELLAAADAALYAAKAAGRARAWRFDLAERVAAGSAHALARRISRADLSL